VEADRVAVLQEPQTIIRCLLRSTFAQAPGHVQLELVEEIRN